MKTIRLFIITFSLVVILSSCGTATMYYWGGSSFSDNMTKYEKVTYDYYKYRSPESICEMIETYQDIIVKCKDNEKMIPPGICAEFGYILTNPEYETYFNEHANRSQKKKLEGIVFYEYGKSLMEKEIVLYPESRQFLEPIIKRMTNDKED